MGKIGQKLTPTIKKKTKKDWHACFPDLIMENKSFGLSRLVGPLLITLGFGTKSFDNEYYPGFGVHNLCRDLDFLSSTLDGPLRIIKSRAPDSLSYNRHEQGLYLEMAERMRQQIILPYEGSISLSMITHAYKTYTDNRIVTMGQLEDPALIAAWAGQPDQAEEALDWGYHQLIRWNLTAEQLKEEGGSAEAWRDQMSQRISQPNVLHNICQRQIIQHHLTSIPQEPLLLE